MKKQYVIPTTVNVTVMVGSIICQSVEGGGTLPPEVGVVGDAPARNNGRVRVF